MVILRLVVLSMNLPKKTQFKFYKEGGKDCCLRLLSALRCSPSYPFFSPGL